MIRVVLPQGLRVLAHVDREVLVDVNGTPTQRSVLDALEREYPMLKGTIRDHQTQLRRPFIRFFACEQDLSHESPDEPLPEAVVKGQEPYLVVGAIAGGSGSAGDPATAGYGVPTQEASASRLMLLGGALAGPTYVLVAALQVFLREGFDITRHPVSLLSLGDYGWIQIANFVLIGLLVIAAALALRRRMTSGTGSTWGPALIGAYGLFLVASGVFVADAADGFPPGTPAGDPETVTWHGILHFMFGGLSFLTLIGAMILLARRFARASRTGWTAFSAMAGVLYLIAFASIAVVAGGSFANFLLTAAVIVGWAWLTGVAVLAYRDELESSGSRPSMR